MSLYSRRNNGIIISGFAAIGKSNIQDHVSHFENKKIYDLSSSYFRKDKGWEKVYCDIVDSLAKEYDYVFISTHNMVIDEMLRRGNKFYIIYPKQYCKDEYKARFELRGDTPGYIDKFMKNWNYFIKMLDDINYEYKISLRSGQYLSDVIERLR